MARIVYVGGRWLPYAAAAVPVEDRGLLFSDSIYEVCEMRGGQLIDAGPHLARLARSADALGLVLPLAAAGFAHLMRETARRNRIRDGSVYLQVTRGAARRDFPAPAGIRPLVVCLARARPPGLAANQRLGVRVITRPDERWRRPDIKSTSLLPNVLAKSAAKAAGAWEAWLVDGQGYVTEGASSNAWIVAGDTVVTRPTDGHILAGVTRGVLLAALAGAGLRLAERPFTVAEAQGAAEAFGTAATALVMPVVAIDDQPIGDGTVGPVVRNLQSLIVARTSPR